MHLSKLLFPAMALALLAACAAAPDTAANASADSTIVKAETPDTCGITMNCTPSTMTAVL